ncbi:MAG TPA: type II toxin-antitoxin system RelE/ParE family toxin [Casimicrobiaceae bacterium]|nr:type II toxin-antitoxin system RelE/ParE family toxin [Casimicrobiaceae bacterium]
MKPVRFHDAARLELLSEIQYYASISPQLARRLATAVEQATELAAQFPEMGSPYKHGTRRVFPRKFPLSVVYLARESEVYVIALAPFRRKPGYWRGRTKVP